MIVAIGLAVAVVLAVLAVIVLALSSATERFGFRPGDEDE